MAAAATAGAARRQKNGGNDALTLARRVGAALNVGVMDFGFYWVTGLCADGTIVVANSYGLGYIPEAVNLPAQIQMATADESIPSERARQVGHLSGSGGSGLGPGAQSEAARDHRHRGTVRATSTQAPPRSYSNPTTSPRAARWRGAVDSRSSPPRRRARLASVSDSGLMELLPPAPADTQPPTDELTMLWFDLCKPLMSTMPDRGVAHLEAFVTYAEHAQELALYRAHTATVAPFSAPR